MSIHLKRIDFNSIISALLCIAARHAVISDGARQQALDEIAASLNNVSAIIARHRLAEQLNAPIPGGGKRHEGNEGDDGDEPDPEDEGEPETDQPAAPDLHPGQAAVLRYIRTHPGCTPAQISDDCDIKYPSLLTYIHSMRKMGIPIGSTNTRPQHYHIQETTTDEYET